MTIGYQEYKDKFRKLESQHKVDPITKESDIFKMYFKEVISPKIREKKRLEEEKNVNVSGMVIYSG